MLGIIKDGSLFHIALTAKRQEFRTTCTFLGFDTAHSQTDNIDEMNQIFDFYG